MANSISLDAKKAYIKKRRSANYSASLKLEGFKLNGMATAPSGDKEKLIAQYTVHSA
jgi:Protein of unknown function (DUF2559)